MNNAELLAGVPEELVRRLDGILDEIPPHLLADFAVPIRQECVEELVRDVETWLDADHLCLAPSLPRIKGRRGADRPLSQSNRAPH